MSEGCQVCSGMKFTGGGTRSGPERSGKSGGTRKRKRSAKRSTKRRCAAYRPTAKNLNTLRRWRRGESIGFTQTSSLKAKGLIPRTSRKNRGKKIVSAKYSSC